jgi:hypothetical protein
MKGFALAAAILRDQFARRFFLFEFCYGCVNFRAAELIDRKSLHDFAFSARRRTGNDEINPFATS